MKYILAAQYLLVCTAASMDLCCIHKDFLREDHWPLLHRCHTWVRRHYLCSCTFLWSGCRCRVDFPSDRTCRDNNWNKNTFISHNDKANWVINTLRSADRIDSNRERNRRNVDWPRRPFCIHIGQS